MSVELPIAFGAGYIQAWGEGQYGAVDRYSTWAFSAATRDDVKHILNWLLEQDIPHARLKRTPDYGYLHEPTGIKIDRVLVPWPNGKNNSVHWRSQIDGVAVDWGKVSNARNLLRILSERQS